MRRGWAGPLDGMYEWPGTRSIRPGKARCRYRARRTSPDSGSEAVDH